MTDFQQILLCDNGGSIEENNDIRSYGGRICLSDAVMKICGLTRKSALTYISRQIHRHPDLKAHTNVVHRFDPRNYPLSQGESTLLMN